MKLLKWLKNKALVWLGIYKSFNPTFDGEKESTIESRLDPETIRKLREIGKE